MVSKVPSMVDMRMDDKEKEEMATPSLPIYPYGLSISLCENELDKLDLDSDDVAIGDILHMHLLARVTSISKNDTQDGSHCRVELQIEYIAAESEDEENEEVQKPKSGPGRFYK